jgi:hypothetical protein
MLSPPDPLKLIANLDRALLESGQDVSLRRAAGTTQQTMRAFVRGYKPAELVGMITQGDRSVVLSPTSLGVFGVPKNGDDISIAGRRGKVQADVEELRVANVLVRVNLRVRMTA